MKHFKLFSLFSAMAILAVGCGNSEQEPQQTPPEQQNGDQKTDEEEVKACPDSKFTGENCDQCKAVGANQMTDGECNIYKTVIINNKTWMAENLRYSKVDHYSADGNSDNDLIYGYLYTWENAMKACPNGWRLPAGEEFLALIGATSYDSEIDTTAIQATSWVSSATNSSGFNALPAGYKYDNGSFYDFGSNATFWSSTPDDSSNAYSLYVDSSSVYVKSLHVSLAFSVRCLKDQCAAGHTGSQCSKITCDTNHGILNRETGKCLRCDTGFYGENCDKEYGSFAASDGNTYKTFIFNDQTWMAENLRNKDIDHSSANGDSNNDSTYGYLYTWENAMKACPQGWRLPTDKEFLTLIGATSYDPEIETTAIQATSWVSSATNISGFNALPAGNNNDGNFYDFGSDTVFWSSTPDDSSYAYSLYVDSDSAIVNDNHVSLAFSVRCLKD